MKLLTELLQPPRNRLFYQTFRGIFLFAAILFIYGTLALTVHAEEPLPEADWLADFTYTLDGTAGTITLKRYNGTRENLVIPGSVELDGVQYQTVLYRYLFLYCDKSTVKSVHISSGVKFPDNSEGLFQNLSALETLTFGTELDTSNVTVIKSLFSRCSALKKLDLSMWDTAGVSSLQSVFYGCESLEEINLAGLDTANVTTMASMFYSCKQVARLDLSGFDTTKVTDMSRMFAECNALAEIDLSSFHTENVTNMHNMFYSCMQMTAVDLSGFDTAKVTDFGGMFYYCYRISELDLSTFDLQAATTTDSMLTSMGGLNKIITPAAVGELSTSIPAHFYKRDASGNLIYDQSYSTLESVPSCTALYRFIGATICFCIDRQESEVALQMIEKDVSAPLRLNTFEKEGYIFQGWQQYIGSTDGPVEHARYSDGEVVTNINLEMDWPYTFLYAIWKPIRSFTFSIPASAQLTFLDTGVMGAEIPYSIVYTGNDADCVRVQTTAGKLTDAFSNEMTLNCWNTRPTWFVLEDGGGTLNEDTGFYEGTGVITVSVNSAYLEGERAGLYTGTLTVTVGYL